MKTPANPVLPVLFLCLFSLSSRVSFSQVLFHHDTLLVGSKIFTLQTITEKEFLSAKEPWNCVADSQAGVKNIHDSLVFFSANGERLAFGDQEGGEEDYGEGEHYTYQCNMKEAGQWLVGHASFENFNYLLVDQENGAVTELGAFCCRPVISPGKKYFICGSDDGNIAGVNRISIYAISKEGVSLIGERVLKDWGPMDFRWVSETEVTAKVQSRNSNGYVRIKIREN